jgi:two-component system chemotaxis response regulator CheY
MNALKVLIVDDNPHARRIARAIVAGIPGIEVFEAPDPKTAMGMAGMKPDLALVDYEMSPMNGVAFTRLIRAGATGFPRELPIIMMTGHADQAHVTQARDAGVHGFVAKPLTVGMVIKQIERTMASIGGPAIQAAPPPAVGGAWH